MVFKEVVHLAIVLQKVAQAWFSIDAHEGDDVVFYANASSQRPLRMVVSGVDIDTLGIPLGFDVPVELCASLGVGLPTLALQHVILHVKRNAQVIETLIGCDRSTTQNVDELRIQTRID